jgi:isoamylase
MMESQWQDPNAHCFGMLLDGRAQETGIRRRGEDATIFLLYNAHYDVVNVKLPEVPEGAQWERLIDTHLPDDAATSLPFGHVYPVAGRSMVALALTATPGEIR